MPSRRFEFKDGKSAKFWEIDLKGTSHVVTFGRIGSKGQSRTKEFGTKEKAKSSYEKLIREKADKGYREVAKSKSGTTKRKSTKTKSTAISAKKKSPKATPTTKKAATRSSRRCSITWVEDEDRSKVALWFGSFRNQNELEKYAHQRFVAELNLPTGSVLRPEKTCFTENKGDVKGLIGQFLWSASFYSAVRRKVRGFDVSSCNGAIALFDYFTDDEFQEATTKVDFLGYFSFDVDADKLIAEASSHLIKDAHIWLARFDSQKRLDEYLEEDLGDDDNMGPISQFASDQRAKFYDHDLVYAEFKKKTNVLELIGCWKFPDASVKQVLQHVQNKRIVDVNTCFVADKNEFKRPRSAKGNGYELAYLGQFEGCSC